MNILFPLPLSPRLFPPLPEGAVLRWSLALFFFAFLIDVGTSNGVYALFIFRFNAHEFFAFLGFF